MRKLKKLTFLSGNEKKVEEVKKILGHVYEGVLEYKSLDLDEIQGSQSEIVTRKITDATKHVDGPCFVEDVSLCLHALNDLPGPYIKHFNKALGSHNLINLVKGFPDSAEKFGVTAVCTVGFIDPESGEGVKLFVGKVKGKIVESNGTQGFGFDPVFLPEGSDQTYAEMTPEKKNSISHRYLAMQAMKQYLDENYE